MVRSEIQVLQRQLSLDVGLDVGAAQAGQRLAEEQAVQLRTALVRPRPLVRPSNRQQRFVVVNCEMDTFSQSRLVIFPLLIAMHGTVRLFWTLPCTSTVIGN